MKVVIDIPNDFTGDYIADKFKDFFSRVIADIDCKGMCGRYEKEIAEMFLKAFDDSEEKISCNCQHNSNSRDNEPCCRCDSRKTNADRIIFVHIWLIGKEETMVRASIRMIKMHVKNVC